jgi:hypothetical protein
MSLAFALVPLTSKALIVGQLDLTFAPNQYSYLPCTNA